MLGEADFDMTQLALDGPNRNRYDRDKNLFVAFSNRPHLDKAASAKEGRPIYKSKEYITIIVPGDKTNVINRPVGDIERRRFADKYAAFKAGKQDEVNGTPLESVPWITREQVEELKYFNIRTLEHLADMPDSNAQKFMGINTLRQRARDAITLAKEQAPALQLKEELRGRDAKIEALEKRLQELAAQIPKEKVSK